MGIYKQWGYINNESLTPKVFFHFFFYVCRTVHRNIFYSKTNQIHDISNLFYFGTTSYVSDTLSVHHQASETVHTESYHTGFVAAC